ncbi:MAG: IS5 family transposase [Cyanobacteria bacterium J06634_6]
MKPSSSPSNTDPTLSALARQLNLSHPLVQMAASIDWQSFEEKFGRVVKASGGRPALPTRLMVGLHYLKALYDESDESVVSKWVENPYWQHFCGERVFQHELPCHPTSLVKWRKQIGVDGFEQLLGQIIQTAMRTAMLKRKQIERVNVDTTVQEKAVAFPTDARLYNHARTTLVRAARKRGIDLRQSYVRVGKYAFFKQSRYRVARQLKRARKCTRKLRTYLGRVIRDIERKLPQPDVEMEMLLSRAKRIEQQQRSDSNKIYSMHAPEVECIAKGKVHKRYEFGCKVVLVTTSASNWIVGAAAVHGNPYDGATLSDVMRQTSQLTGVAPKQAAVDKGFRGTKHHPDGLQVLVAGTRKFKGVLKRLVKRRSAIEPVIGHIKHDHALGRNFLKGKRGDRINALMAACGFNLRKLFRFFEGGKLSRWRSLSS